MLLSYSGDGHGLITLNESLISEELSNTGHYAVEHGYKLRRRQLDQYQFFPLQSHSSWDITCLWNRAFGFFFINLYITFPVPLVFSDDRLTCLAYACGCRFHYHFDNIIFPPRQLRVVINSHLCSGSRIISTKPWLKII